MKEAPRKPEVSLVPKEAIYAIAEGLEDGHRRCGYEPNDWRNAKSSKTWEDAALRHVIEAICNGEWYDPQTGIPHLAKAMSNLAIVLTLRGYEYGKPHGYDISASDQQGTGTVGSISNSPHSGDS